jgi:hypothetical protein
MVSRIIFIRCTNLRIIIEHTMNFLYNSGTKTRATAPLINRVRNQNSARTDGILLQAGREGTMFGMILTRLPDRAVC